MTAAPRRAGGEPLTAEHTLHLAEQSAPATVNAGTPSVINPIFAAVAAIGLFALAAVLLAPLAYRLYDTDAADPVDRLATLTTMALLGIGVVVLLLGVYLALLEVRGRRVRLNKQTGNGEPGPAPDRSGWPSGPVILLLVIGCVPLVAAAWVAQSGVDGQSEAASTATARAATRTPSPVPSPTVTPAP